MLEIHGLCLGLVLAHSELLEGRLERERRIDKDAVGEGDARATGAGLIGEHKLHHLLRERVQFLGVTCTPISEYGDELVTGGAARASGDETECDVQGERREGDIAGSTLGVGGDGGSEAEGEAGLVCDGETVASLA